MTHNIGARARWVLVAAVFAGAPALASDHNEAPGVQADGAADIDDIYAWHTGDGKIVAILTFGGPGGHPAGPPDPYDADVLFGIQLDNSGDLTADHTVWVRFGQDDQQNWGVQVEGLPGASGTVSGAVDTVIDAGNGLSVEAGTFDDPFFFDLTGFTDTLNTGTLSFDASRDSFAGKNVHAIIVQMDATAATSGNPVRIWATSGRK